MKYLASLLLILCASCSQLSFEIPSGRMQSPEAKGQFLGGDIDIRLVGSTKTTITPRESATQETDIIDYSHNQIFSSFIELGSYDFMDFFLMTPHDSPNIYGLKFQILGPRRAEKKEDTTSLALTLGFGDMEETDQDIELFSSNPDITYNTYRIKAQDVSIILGHRVNKSTIYYSTLSYTNYDLKTRSTENPSTRVLDHRGHVYGLHVGAIMVRAETLSLKIETAVQKISWDIGDDTVRGYINLAIGLEWPGFSPKTSSKE